jgi:uncharacterized protein
MGTADYVRRHYRERMGSRFRGFLASYKETDLWIGVDRGSYDARMEDYAASRARRYRMELESYCAARPDFLASLAPIAADPSAPAVARAMMAAGAEAGVGPMAAVAGAVAEFVGRDIDVEFGCAEVIVENGGDLWMKFADPIDAAVFAGISPLSGRVGVSIPPRLSPLGLCTSSGTVGPSLSLGSADAAMIAYRAEEGGAGSEAERAGSACAGALADAWATVLGNAVSSEDDIEKALDATQGARGLVSALVVKGGKMGIRGALSLKLFAPGT